MTDRPVPTAPADSRQPSPGDSRAVAPRVQHTHGGAVVLVDGDGRWGQVVAPEPKFWGGSSSAVQAVRERTSDDWWLAAAEIDLAQNDGSTGGPVGAGVDFLAEEAVVMMPYELRQAIADDAYEAAREAIFDGFERFARQLIPVIHAIERFSHGR